MLSLKIYFKGGIPNTKMDFKVLGLHCQKALSFAGNTLSVAKTRPEDIPVSFMQISEWDLNAPDIRFVIDGGGEWDVRVQRNLCMSFYEVSPGGVMSVQDLCEMRELEEIGVESSGNRGCGFRRDKEGQEIDSF